MDSGSALLCFILHVVTTSGVKRRSACQRSWQSYGDWGCPQQAGFANLAGGLVWRNGASVYTDAQLASLQKEIHTLYMIEI